MYGQPNNFGYQYYQPQMRYQPMQQVPQQQQPMQTMDYNKPNILQGKIVESIDVVKSIDIPIDR